jgi:ATP-dependent Lhr-like helicase
MEARGDVRGGRFVAAQYGEQFALPEAVELLRAQRNHEPTGEIITIHAADPLNLSGIVFPGEKIPALSGHRLLLRDGLLIGYLRGKTCHFTVPISEGEAWELQNRLLQGPRRFLKAEVARNSNR